MKIGVVIVHFGDWTKTNTCIESLRRGSMIPAIVVIDNSFDNRGYGTACNIGVSSFSSCEKVVVMNNDCWVGDKTVELLYQSKYDYCCPEIRDRMGNTTYYGGEIKRGGPKHWTVRWAGDMDTSFLQGSCICFKKDKWLGFDDKYFMYFEDVDLSKRVKAEGYTMGVVHGAVLTHDSQASVISRYWSARNYRKAMGNTLYYYLWWIPKRVIGLLLMGKTEESLAVLRGMMDQW